MFKKIHCIKIKSKVNNFFAKGELKMKKYCMWKDTEVKELFDFVATYNKSNKPLSTAFKNYANEHNRKPNSVRNYYYLELANLLENKQRTKKLGIDLSLHSKKQAKYFSKEETESTILQIENLCQKGYSVRKACLTIANGNIEEMVRLQNKYRAIKKQQCTKSNIISMPKRQNRLTDNEINSLFLGLVRLIKAQAKQEINISVKNEKEKANNILRQTILELANKDKQIENMKKQFELLKNDNNQNIKIIQKLRTENAKLNLNSKNSKLKKWAEKNLKQKNKEQKIN